MDSLKLNNYIDIKENYSHKDLFFNKSFSSEVLKSIKEYVDEKISQSGNINKATLSDYVVVQGDVIIEEGTEIDSFVKIEGPVIIGKNVKISSGAYIRAYSIIGDNVKIGHGSEVKHSILFDNSKIASLAFVGDSIIGYNSRVGSGVITSNRRFDQENIKVYNNSEKFDTELDFIGTVLGDNSRLGASVITYPGTHIGMYTNICPNITVRDIIPADMILKPTSIMYEMKEKSRKELSENQDGR